MIRQGTSQFQPIPYEQVCFKYKDRVDLMLKDSFNNQNGPKKFTSVADMKRKKHRNGVPSPSVNRLPRTTSSDEASNPQPIYEIQHQPLKSFSSSPDLQSAFRPPHSRKQSTDSTSNYSKPYRTLRPKTPPPPVPTFSEVHSSGPVQSAQSTVTVVKTQSVPPPPAPPLPTNFLSGNAGTSQPKTSQPSTSATPSSSTATDPTKSDCRGISAEALCNVRLKPVSNNNASNASRPSLLPHPTTTTEAPTNSAAPKQTSNKKLPLDFDSDLRSALAKRRGKVCSDDDTSEAGTVEGSGMKRPVNNGFQPPTINGPVSRYGGLSLRESVRENVSAPPKLPTKQHSPPGFANKKDSG